MSSDPIENNRAATRQLAIALGGDPNFAELGDLIGQAEKVRQERDNLKAVVNEAAEWAQEAQVKLPAGLLGRLLMQSDKGKQIMGRILRTMIGKKGEE